MQPPTGLEPMTTLPLLKISGIYFLCQGPKVVYVGQSVNVYARAFNHTDKVFDNAWFIPYPVNDLENREQYWIKKLYPVYNVIGEQNKGKKRLARGKTTR